MKEGLGILGKQMITLETEMASLAIGEQSSQADCSVVNLAQNNDTAQINNQNTNNLKYTNVLNDILVGNFDSRNDQLEEEQENNNKSVIIGT